MAKSSRDKSLLFHVEPSAYEGTLSRTKKPTESQDVARARDELFSHIHRCGVLRATPEQQEEWMQDTIEFMAERYPDLSPESLEELRAIGLRFCRPVIASQPAPAPAQTSEEGTDADAEAAAA
jgi:hypothetical protein